MFGFKRRRRQRIHAEAIPLAWVDAIERHVAHWRGLDEDQRTELLRIVQVLLAEKEFVGAGGLELTEPMAAVIAAQAAVLLLGRDHDYYPRLRSVVVYPRGYTATVQREGLTGLAQEVDERRLGESWHAGTVVLAWSSVVDGAADDDDGHNVVFHEFAHQLDSENPRSDGAPVLRGRGAYGTWAQHMGDAYRTLLDELERYGASMLGDYAATNAAEFFAVVTEFFFERPGALRHKHPELYALLVEFYGQDPADREPAVPEPPPPG